MRRATTSRLLGGPLLFVLLVFVAGYAVAVLGVIELTLLPIPPPTVAVLLAGMGLALVVVAGVLAKRAARLRQEVAEALARAEGAEAELRAESDARARAERSWDASESELRAASGRLAEAEARTAEAERSSRRTEALRHALARAVPAAVLTYDTVGIVVAAEGAAVGAIAGDTVVGRSVVDLAARHPHAGANLARALEGEEFTVVEVLADRRLETRYVPLREGDTVTGALAISSDLSERDRVEERLRESEERARRMFEESPIAEAFVAPDGRVLLANAAFREAAGVPAGDARVPRFAEVVESAAADTSLEERLLRGEVPSYRAEGRVRRQDGGVLPVEVVVVAVRDARGRVLCTLRMLKEAGGRERDEALAQHYARHDAVTELANRILLEEKLEESLVKMRREKERLALVFFEVDNLGPLAERFGRAGKDALLREAARRFGVPLWDGDTLARIGDGTFALVLPRRGAAGTAQIIEKIVTDMTEGLPVDGQLARLDLRLGFAMFPEDAATKQDLLRQADAALAFAKQSGRRCVRYQSGVMR